MLEIKNLKKSFGNKQILKNVNLSIKSGEIVGLIGNNGAGKSTLLKVILGLLESDNGDVYINEKKLIFSEKREGIRAFIEEPLLLGNLTGHDNLIYHSKLTGVSDIAVSDIIERFNLKTFINIKTSEYSLGMKQLLGLAVNFLNKPNLMLLDESLNSLDPKNVLNIKKQIVEQSKQGTAIFITSHILSNIEELCNKVYLLKDGTTVPITNDYYNTCQIKLKVSNIDLAKLILENYGYRIISSSLSQRILRVEGKEEEVPEILKLLLKEEIRIYEVSPIKRSLSELFI